MDENNKKYFKEILCKSQSKLLDFCCNELNNNGYQNIHNTEHYIFAEGDIPVLVVAHCDRMCSDEEFKEYEIEINNTTKIEVCSYNGVHATFEYCKPVEVWTHPKGIAGDDRCGVFCILEAIKAGCKPYVLFTTNEENGSKGTKKFIYIDIEKYEKENLIKDNIIIDHANLLKKNKFFIQIDRGHLTSETNAAFEEKTKINPYGRDLIYYKITTNDIFTKDIEKIGIVYGFHNEESKRKTDIVHLSKATNIASVNISSGYFGEHLTTEIIVIEEVENTYKLLCKLIEFAKESEYYKAK